MVHYHLAGKVTSEEYAICERLLGIAACNILCVTLPSFSVSKTAYKNEKWPAAASELMRIHGFLIPMSNNLVICDVVIWTETGRLLCTDVDAFSTWVLRNYGIQCDLSDTELMLYIKANVDELRKQQQKEQQADEASG